MTGVLYGLAKFLRAASLRDDRRVARGDGRARRRFAQAWAKTPTTTCRCPGPTANTPRDTLSHSFPDQANGTSPIVLHAAIGKLTESKYANAVNEAAADVAKAPHVASVVNPLTPRGRQLP